MLQKLWETIFGPARKYYITNYIDRDLGPHQINFQITDSDNNVVDDIKVIIQSHFDGNDVRYTYTSYNSRTNEMKSLFFWNKLQRLAKKEYWRHLNKKRENALKAKFI